MNYPELPVKGVVRKAGGRFYSRRVLVLSQAGGGKV
jgi:hypothetical protein